MYEGYKYWLDWYDSYPPTNQEVKEALSISQSDIYMATRFGINGSSLSIWFRLAQASGRAWFYRYDGD